MILPFVAHEPMDGSLRQMESG